MAITTQKRSQIEKLILDTFKFLDTSGNNVKRYTELFKNMSNEQFEKYIRKITDNPDNNFYLEVVPYNDEPSLESIKKCLNFLGATTEEYVYYKHELSDGKPVRTTKPVPVIYMHIKKLRQVLSKKNNFSFDASSRNALTDQVTSDSKVSRNSDSESYALLTLGANKSLQELSGARADNASARQELYNSIASQGFARLDQLPTKLSQKSTLNLLDIYLLSAGLKSDLLSKGDVLTNTTLSNN